MAPLPAAPAAARGLELPVVVAISFSAFVIGVSLAGGVWLLHGRTGRVGSGRVGGAGRWGGSAGGPDALFPPGPAETPARSPLPAAQPAPRA